MATLRRRQQSLVNSIAKGVNPDKRAAFVAAVVSAISGYASTANNTRIMKTAIRLARQGGF